MMNRKIQDRKRELYNQAMILRGIAIDQQPLSKQKELREQQDDAYKRFVFLTKLDEAMRGK